MDDLSGLSWANSKSNTSNATSPKPTGANYSSFSTPPLQPTPPPASQVRQARTTTPSTQPKKSADPFASLNAFTKGNRQDDSKLTLQERAKQLEAERAKKEAEQRAKLLGVTGGNVYGDINFLDGLGNSQRASPAPVKSPLSETEDDILAAFKADAPVDSQSHYPPPGASPLGGSSSNTPVYGTPANSSTPLPPDDDDPFGLAEFQAKRKPAVKVQPAFDDDILGDLAKPVSEIQIQRSLNPSPAPEPQRRPSPLSNAESASPAAGQQKKVDGWDTAIAEIMDMGFTLDQAKEALSHTKTGTDVEIAVGWLLTEAHRKTSKKEPTEPRRDQERAERSERPRNRRTSRSGSRTGSRTRSREGSGRSTPAWASGGKAGGEKDITAIATEVGSSLFKSANSLWAQGKKKAAQAVKEFQEAQAQGGGGRPSDGRPKWMQEQDTGSSRRSERSERPEKPRPAHSRADGPSERAVTDEALMLEIGMDGPPRKSQPKGTPPALKSRNPFAAQERRPDTQAEMERAIRQKEQEMREREAAASKRRADMIRKQEEGPASGYVSPNRRRTPKPSTPQPERRESPQPEVDLFDTGAPQQRRPQQPQQRSTPQPQSNNPFSPAASSRTASPAVSQAPPRKKTPPQRAPVQASPSALSTSATSRFAGSAAFKRGDYTDALEKYNKALSPLPSRHLERIIVLNNRSACYLKLGDPKAAVTDCEEILAIIGPARGESESVQVQTEAGPTETKPMKDYWSKALTRKAEALEQMEKYQDALELWSMAVSANIGGASAAAGKRRCETALRPKPAPVAKPQAPKRAAPPKPASKPSAAANAAVSRLREANAAQNSAEAEKFALHDIVEQRVATWKGPTDPNLRALIANMDTVLWPEAGWKKVGMHELVMANKVKIQYMKAISKVHPDKIPQNATTEQQMISAAVFSVLNEAWDKFKTENGL